MAGQQKILIVEDEKLLNEAYELILKKAGFDVSIAFNGRQALDLTKGFEPDLILLDLRMPILGGVGFLEKYQLAKKHPSVKVIVFSNIDTQKEINQAYDLGAEKYMLKSWASPKDLVKLVKETLKNPKK